MPLSTKKPVRKKALVADSHPLMRQSVMDLLQTQAAMVCCAQAGSVEELYEAAHVHKPDLVIMELRLGRGDGLELIKKLRTANPNISILVFSHQDGLIYAERAMQAGATGYISKDQPANKVLEAIQTVSAGQVYMSRGLAATMLHRFVGRARANGQALPQLTDRELHILELLGAGLTTRQIAKTLNRSFKTIEAHRENIKRKIGLPGASALIKYAVDWAGTHATYSPGRELASTASKPDAEGLISDSFPGKERGCSV